MSYLEILFRCALKHIITTVAKSFDFIRKMRAVNEITVNLINHLKNYLRLEFCAEIQIEDLVFFIMSVIIMNHYSSEMHYEFNVFHKT